MANNSQDQWTALKAKYATPPWAEDPRMRARRLANRRKAASRLQHRQVQRLLEAQQAAAIVAGEPPRIELTQAERTGLACRFASPVGAEPSPARLRRENDRRHAENRIDARVAARRLLLDQDASALPDATTPSYALLSAAVLNLNPVPNEGKRISQEVPSALRNLSSSVAAAQAEHQAFPTYAQLATALRKLTPEVPSQDDPSPGFPSYAQLNAALRNLSPDVASQEEPAPGHPTYRELAGTIRGLPPSVTADEGDSTGFPTYAQLAAALRALLAEENPGTRQRAAPVRRNAALGSLTEFQSFPRHQLPPRDLRCGHCGSMLWRLELPNACCLNDDVTLAPAELPPERIQQLFSNRTFLEKIRGYNSAFAFTSTGAKEDYLINRGNAPYTFRINGSMEEEVALRGMAFTYSTEPAV